MCQECIAIEGKIDAERAAIGERVKCDWTKASDEQRSKNPRTVVFHMDHGDDMSKCDAWVCLCGNSPHTDGFDEFMKFMNGFRCDRCYRLIDEQGYVVGQLVK